MLVLASEANRRAGLKQLRDSKSVPGISFMAYGVSLNITEKKLLDERTKRATPSYLGIA